MKSLGTVLLIFALLPVAGCGAQESTTPGFDLHTAAVIGNLEAIQKHIALGSDLDLREPTRGSTALITAAVFGKSEVAVALIEAGADVDIQNNEGSTALITASLFCRTEIVTALLNNGADKSLRNTSGSTALDTVSPPFDAVKGIYDVIGAALSPLGLKLDYERLETTRPKIAEMLR